VYVFDNDYPALLEDVPEKAGTEGPLIRFEPATGKNRVICYSPRHDQTLASMDIDSIEQVVASWIDQFVSLGSRYRWVQVFQNQGEMMGAFNPHPHGQVWAIDALPNEPRKEDECQRSYRLDHGSSLLADYLNYELDRGDRLVLENDHWLVVVPFWAVWPFETLVLPKREVPRMPDLTPVEISGLAQALKRLLTGYDSLFDVPFPYSMGWHGAPFGSDDSSHWQLHAHFYPPLLRSASVRKFMVGYEMLAEAQRDLTAEQAAAALRRSLE
jgi:UDPglucose--hexose-1-phosphate uridylyltransferase